MEFVQFHPTGMVWPPSVAGILVTEGSPRGRRCAEKLSGRALHVRDIPPLYRNQTADNEEEGWRYTQGDKEARRPPELLTRDHVARCIVREIKEGRGSPHGGVFLDISWIKERLPNAAEHIKRKLPSMYHQFKELADIDITEEAMEVGPTTHYVMGGVRVDADSQETDVPGLYAAGECAAGLHGANRLGGNSLSDLLVFGKRAGEYAARYAVENAAGEIHRDQVAEVAQFALEPFDRGVDGQDAENPFEIQQDLQDMMQEKVGIVRNQRDMQDALEGIERLRQRAARIVLSGNREYNPGWHTALDLTNLLTYSEAIARAALERKESRGAHCRLDYPDKDEAFGKLNIAIRKNSDGTLDVSHEPIAAIPDACSASLTPESRGKQTWRRLHSGFGGAMQARGASGTTIARSPKAW